MSVHSFPSSSLRLPLAKTTHDMPGIFALSIKRCEILAQQPNVGLSCIDTYTYIHKGLLCLGVEVYARAHWACWCGCLPMVPLRFEVPVQSALTSKGFFLYRVRRFSLFVSVSTTTENHISLEFSVGVLLDVLLFINLIVEAHKCALLKKRTSIFSIISLWIEIKIIRDN